MADLIDKQKASEQNLGNNDSICTKTGLNDEDRTTGDCISRKQAIDALNEYFTRIGKLKRRGLTKGEAAISLDVVGAISSLPSAQSEHSQNTPQKQPDFETFGVKTGETCADAISRQEVIEIFTQLWDCVGEIADKDEWEDVCKTTANELPSAQPERTCVNCGRTANNGGWYADGRTRCPIEEHYALPKDGYCHLWEKRNITDDDYPERRTDE